MYQSESQQQWQMQSKASTSSISSSHRHLSLRHRYATFSLLLMLCLNSLLLPHGRPDFGLNASASGRSRFPSIGLRTTAMSDVLSGIPNSSTKRCMQNVRCCKWPECFEMPIESIMTVSLERSTSTGGRWFRFETTTIFEN